MCLMIIVGTINTTITVIGFWGNAGINTSDVE